MDKLNFDKEELAKAGPYHHDVELPDGSYTTPDTFRVRFFEEAFLPSVLHYFGGSLEGKSVLDIGCNCGGFSFLAKKYGAKYVEGVDVRPELIAQAEILKKNLNYKGVNFVCLGIEDYLKEKTNCKFDLILMMGVIYHFANPISIFEKISRIANQHLVIDSHVHYSSNNKREDMPLWWMLADTDIGETHDLPEEDSLFSKSSYLELERAHSVNYSLLPDPYIPGPHKERNLRIAEKLIPDPNAPGPVEDTVRSDLNSPFSLVPNKQALIKLVRAFGYRYVSQLETPRISEPRYLLRHRIVLVASR